MRLDRRELAGAVADVGVLVPIAVALVVQNGLSPTAVLLPAGLLYVAVALVYRLPVAVQPLKAVGAIALAHGLGADVIAAAALLVGVLFAVLAAAGVLDAAARAFPRPLVRGVQLTVGILLLTVAWTLVADPPAAFAQHALPPSLALGLALALLALALALRRTPVALALVAAGGVVAFVLAGEAPALGPSPLAAPSLDAATFWTALVLLVVPQAPLTFANSCLAPADAARTYFGERARTVRPGRLAATLGGANLFAGSIGGMPVCHGAGGMTAHYSFGARTAGAPLFIGALLVFLALALGSGLAGLLAAFPLPILAALLAGAGLLHALLLRDLRTRWEWAVALLVAALGVAVNLAVALVAGLAVWWLPRLAGKLRTALAPTAG